MICNANGCPQFFLYCKQSTTRGSKDLGTRLTNLCNSTILNCRLVPRYPLFLEAEEPHTHTKKKPGRAGSIYHKVEIGGERH